jgi:general L-amino acid transport system substrate-binding protein
MYRKSLLFALMAALAMLVVACSTPAGAVETVIVEVTPSGGSDSGDSGDSGEAMGADTLAAIIERDAVVCGSNQAVPGFGFLEEDGSFSGFDVDFCRALAAAVLGDASKVEFRPLTASERFTALQTGEIDVLIRNTTWTLTRDTELGANFAPTIFYDGQGMMVREESGITTLDELDGATICVSAGTTTELNLADVFASRGIAYTPLVFETADEVAGAYEDGRCDAYTTDKSALVARRTIMAEPSAHVILDETMSKEPLGPVVRHGDDKWFDVVQWVVFATFTAEEFGITSANVDDIRSSTENPSVAKLLGLEGDMGAKLGLSNDWAYNVISQVGSFAEIYDRNLGPGTPTFIPRGLNSLFTDGGLIYAPPVR